MKITHNTLIKYGLLSLVILFANLSFAQNTPQLKDYIIDKTGNKIIGEIQSFRRNSTPKYIKFKKEGNSEFSKYYSSDLGGFIVKGVEYVSARVTVNPRTTISPMGERNTPEEKIQDQVFIENLFKGNGITLYKAKVKGSLYFFIKGGQGLETLYYKKYTISDEQGTRRGELKKYIGQLKLYLKGCEAIQSKINVVSYSKSSLVRLMKVYVKCNEPVAEKKKEENRRKFGVIGGVSLAKLRMSSSDPDLVYLTDANYSKSLNFYGGFSFQHPYRGNVAFVHEWLYVSYRFSGVQSDEVVRKGGLVSIVRIGQSFFKFNNLVKFKYKNSLFYTTLGLSTGVRVRENNSLETVATTVAGFSNDVIPESSIFELGVLGGVGIHSQKASLELRVEYANGPSTTPKSSVSRCYAAVSLYF